MIKVWHRYSRLCWLFLLVLPLIAGCGGGGVTQFFLGLLVGTGKWISQTLVGQLIENSRDYLVSYLNPDIAILNDL